MINAIDKNIWNISQQNLMLWTGKDVGMLLTSLQ